MGLFILLFINNPSFAELDPPPTTEETSGTVETTEDDPQNSEPEEEGATDTAVEKDTADVHHVFVAQGRLHQHE